MANNTYTQMDDKQSLTVVLPKESFENDYQDFIIDATQKKGGYIVENAIDEMTAQGADTSIIVDGETPSISEISYSTKRKENYIYKVQEEDLKNASNNDEAYNELMAKVNANLDEQDRKNCWREFPKILSRTDGLKTSQLVYGTDITKYADMLLAMRDDIRKIRTPQDTYTAYTKTVGSETKTLKSFSNRPVIFIRSDILDKIEVNFESGVFNLDKIRVDARIVRVNNFYKFDTNGNATIDDTKIWLTCGAEYAKIYKHFEKRASLEDVRSFNIGKAVTYIEYVSKLVPAVWHLSGTAAKS